MSKTPNTAAASVRRLLFFVLIVAGAGFLLNTCVLSPLQIRFSSDVAYQNAWWVNMLYYLTVEGILDLVVFALCYSATVFAVWQVGVKGSLPICLTYTGLTLGKFLINFTMTSLTDGALPDLEEFLAVDLPMILVMFLLEILQYALVILIVALVRHRYHARIRIAEGMKLLPASQQVEYPLPTPPFPFVRLLSFKNPLQRTALLSALLVFAGRFGMHFFYQITLYNQFGASDGWVVMLIDLIADLLVGVLFYFAFLLLLPKFHAAAEGEATPAS